MFGVQYSIFLWPKGQSNRKAGTFLLKVQQPFPPSHKPWKGEQLKARGCCTRWWNNCAWALPWTALLPSMLLALLLLLCCLSCAAQSFHWGGWKFVKLLVVTSTQKRAVTHHNDTLSSSALSQHCKAPLEKYKLSGWKNWDTELATLKTQLSLKAVTSYQFSFFTSILPIIFENLCQILLSLVIGLQRIIKCCKSLSPLGITQVIVWLHSITELNNEDR